MILGMLNYVAPSSGRHSKLNHRNEISAVKNHKKCFTTNNYDVNYLQYLFMHGIPEAILKMLAAENDADGW